MRYARPGKQTRAEPAAQRRAAMQAKFLTPLILALALAPVAALSAADQDAPAAAPAAAPAEAAAAPAAPVEEPGVRLSATLNGANEVGGGDPDGTGSFTARIDRDKMCYTLTVANIDDATMAHIHKGAAGVNGPVFIGLPEIDPGEHCEEIGGDRLGDLRSRPQNYYVNVHNGDFPGGAVRGQLSKN
jgi:hypothetical protein